MRRETVAKRTIPLRWVFAGSVMVLITALTLGTARIIIEREKGVLEEETLRRLLAQGRNLSATSATALLDEFPEFVLHPAIKDLLEENRELSYAVVVDRNGRIRGDRDLRRVDLPFEDRPDFRPLTAGLGRGAGERFRADDRILEVTVPVRYRDGSELGAVHLGLEREHLAAVLREAQRSTLAVLLGTLSVGLVFALFLASRVVRPIQQLTRGTEEIGRGNLDYKIVVKSRNEVGVLARTFNEMTGRLREAQRDLVEKERLGRELEIAHEIEEKLLPRPNLGIPGYDVAGFHQSARTVGGDYWDLIPIDDERVGITVADVAGKGIPGLVVMAMTSALLRTHARRHDSPAAMLAELNRMLRPNLRRGMFITMFYGVLHIPTGRFVFASAGHNPLLHFRRRGGLGDPLGTEGIPLGLFGDDRFDERIRDDAFTLDPDDGFVQYTDGVNEATNPRKEEFGTERLLASLAGVEERTAQETVDRLVGAVRAFTGDEPPSDDITVLCIRRAAAVPAAVDA
ncbi:MAG: SpoIIE family protein phosphatase [Candidatus Eisenbacteria bacterium]|nr:SpoIIE family protein phosphatase [Candidatus Eisenbacteria bacterium]